LKYFIMDILACPSCKSRDLALYTIEVEDEGAGPDPERVKCKRFCHYLRVPADQAPPTACRECVTKRIVVGVIICKSCGRWYPVEDTIAYMLDDKYREDEKYARWLERYWDRLPGEARKLMKVPEVGRLRGVGGGGEE